VEDNIKLDLGETGGSDIDWIHLAQDRKKVKSSSEHGNEPLDSIKCWEIHAYHPLLSYSPWNKPCS
jgi:hypothetical protein